MYELTIGNDDGGGTCRCVCVGEGGGGGGHEEARVLITLQIYFTVQLLSQWRASPNQE